MKQSFQFRSAKREDVPLILQFIKELADYEKMLDEVVADEATLETWIFDKQKAEVLFVLDDGKEAGEHCSILYNPERFELVDYGNFSISEQPDTYGVKGWDAACNRTVTWGRFVNKDSGNEFFFFNTHLDHMGQTARQEGVKLVKDRIKQIAGDMPAVLCGDMNSDSDDPIFTPLQGYMQLARTACADTDTMRTYNGYGKDGGSRIDHVFFKGVEPLRFSVMDEDYGVPYISDHYPVRFDFVLKGVEDAPSAEEK